MKPLPERRYEYAEWEKHKVNIDYHVEVDRHYYSVPYQLRVSSRRQDNRNNRGAPLQGQKSRMSCKELHPWQAHNRNLSYTRVSQTLSRMDALTHCEVGGENRAIDGSIGQRDHGEKTPSRAGFLLMPGYYTSGKTLRAGKTGGRLYKGPLPEGLLLQERRVDPSNNLDGKDLPVTITGYPFTHENIRGTTYYAKENTCLTNRPLRNSML